jgi:hypothetical protein
MTSCYYLVHISATASELPHPVTDFLHHSLVFDTSPNTILFLPRLPARRKASETSFALCLVAQGEPRFAQQPFIHIHSDSTAV